MKICEYTNILTRPDTQPKEVSDGWAGAVMQVGKGNLGLEELQCGWIEAVVLEKSLNQLILDRPKFRVSDIPTCLFSFLQTQLHIELPGQCQKMTKNSEISVQS